MLPPCFALQSNFQLWSMFLEIFGMSRTMPKSTMELLRCGQRRVVQEITQDLEYHPLAIWWIVWLKRNDRIFEAIGEVYIALNRDVFFLQLFGETWLLQWMLMHIMQFQIQQGICRICSYVFSLWLSARLQAYIISLITCKQKLGYGSRLQYNSTRARRECGYTSEVQFRLLEKMKSCPSYSKSAARCTKHPGFMQGPGKARTPRGVMQTTLLLLQCSHSCPPYLLE